MLKSKALGSACLAMLICAIAVPAWAEFQTLSGTVAYREKIALPPDALVEITLEDVSLADAKAIPLGMVTVKAADGVPVDFEIRYDDQMVLERHRYTVRAVILVDDKAMWRSTQSFPALTNGAPETVDVLVQMMQGFSELNLSGTAWKVVGLNGAPIQSGRLPILAFDAEGRASGSSGCNRFSGGYSLDDDKISFGPLASTRMACPGELATQEMDFFKALGAVASAHTEGAQLVLKNSDGDPLMALVPQ